MTNHAWVLENLESYVAGGLAATERGDLEQHTAECAMVLMCWRMFVRSIRSCRTCSGRRRPVQRSKSAPFRPWRFKPAGSTHARPDRRRSRRGTGVDLCRCGASWLVDETQGSNLHRTDLSAGGLELRLIFRHLSALGNGGKFPLGTGSMATNLLYGEPGPARMAEEFRYSSLMHGHVSHGLNGVLVAKKNLDSGAPLKRPEDMFEIRGYREGNQPPNAVANLDQLKDKFLKRNLRRGDFVRPEDLTDQVISLNLPDGQRALGIRVNNNSIAGGWAALPGSRVDLLWTSKKGNEDETSTKMLMENVLVMAADGEASRPDKVGATLANVITVAPSRSHRR